MIERDIESTLHELAESHVRHEAPADVREDARLVPLTTPQRRSWLPQASKWGFQAMISATKYLVAGAIVALFGGFLVAGMMTQPSDLSMPAPGASASASPATGYEVTEVDRPTDAYPSVVTDDALWLVDGDGQAVVRIDAQTSELTTISVDSEPQTLAASGDAIWVVGSSDVHRIDRTDLTVSEGPIRRSSGEPFAVSGTWDGPIVAAGSLWIPAPGSEDDTLVEIDLVTQTIRGEYPAPIAWPGNGLDTLAAIGDAIWVQSDGRMDRFDLPTRSFTDPVELPLSDGCCIASDDAIWLTGGETGRLWRVDPDTLEVTEALALDVGLAGGVAIGDALWLGTWRDYTDDTGWRTDRAILRFDTRTRAVTDMIPVPSNGLLGMVEFDGALWTGYGGDHEDDLLRIDVDSRRVVGTLRIPSAHKQDGLIPSETVMWVETSTPGDCCLWRVDRVAAAE